MKEIEILFSLQEPILSAKRKFGSVSWRTAHVKDTYYQSKDHSRLSPDANNRLTSSLRLREKNDVYTLTYKDDRFDAQGVWLYSDEHEVCVSELKITKTIFAALHYKELVVIDTKKHLCEIDGYEIVLEKVKGLGNFIEIEYKGKRQIAKKAVASLKQTMRTYLEEKDIRIGVELNAGKPELALQKMHKTRASRTKIKKGNKRS